VGAGPGLADSLTHIELDSGVVVDRAVVGEHPAVTVIGELVQAGVGDDHQVVADLGADGRQRSVEDAVLGVAGRPGRVLVVGLRDAEQHQAADARFDRPGRLGADGVDGVLHDAGK